MYNPFKKQPKLSFNTISFHTTIANNISNNLFMENIISISPTYKISKIIMCIYI